ncbi:MAG: phosphohydrolase [bacterium]|nr:phosphohydrolase [bacterium]
MAVSQCPGQDKRFWKPTDVFELPCSYCGEPLEFWKDDLRRRCHACGQLVPNPRFDLGCAQWCQFSAKCLGQPVGDAGEALVDALIREMRGVFGDDQGRIRHALAVLDCAEQILVGEGGDPLVVRAAAVLHGVGNHGQHTASAILERLGVDTERAGQVLRIIGSHGSAGDADTPEFRILWDADRLASIPDECGGKAEEEARFLVERSYRTATGRAIGREAVERFLGTPRPRA